MEALGSPSDVPTICELRYNDRLTLKDWEFPSFPQVDQGKDAMKSSATPSSLDKPCSPRWMARILPLVAGSLAGMCLFVWTHQYVATFGVSFPVTAGLALSLAVGVCMGWCVRERLATSNSGRHAAAIAWLVIAVWTLAFRSLLAMSRSVVGLVPASWLETEATAFAMMLFVGLGLLATPTMALIGIGLRRTSRHSSGHEDRFPVAARYLLGCGIGLGAAPILMASWLSVEHIGHMIVGPSAIAFWVTMVRATAQAKPPASSSGGLSHEASIDRQRVVAVACASLLTGAVMLLASRLVLQFLPGSGYEFFAMFGGLLAGAAWGVAWSTRLRRGTSPTLSQDGVLTAAVLAACWPAVLLLTAPLLMDWSLALNAGVESVAILTFVRWSIGFVALLPPGVAAGRLCTQRVETGNDFNLSSVLTTVLCTSVGLVLMRSLWVSLSISVLVVTLSAVTLSVTRLWKSQQLVLRRRQWVGGTFAVAVVGLLPITLHNHRPDLVAQLLFSAQSFQAHNAGMKTELLPHIDDGRLVTVRDGRDTDWTIWKHRGSQLHLRQNGIPSGIVSTDPVACPQFPGDVMQAIVPLVVHPHPDRVLVVGLGSTVAVSTCLACPVRQVTCLEGDAELIRINDEVIATASGFNALDDDRLELRNVDPTLALLAKGETYDIVIVGDAHPSLMREGSRFTREFYASAAGHLNPGGLFSQRLQYADFGRQPIETALATLQSVFPQVACLESAPGEIVLLASNTEESMFDESLFDRCQADHIRRLLAEQGWDWSVMVNLSAISPEQIRELAAGDVAINTVGNGRFTYRLPQEVMRWGPKWREIVQLFSERGSRMLAWVGDSEKIPEVGKRLKDMSEQHRLIVEYPDRWNAYRATLRKRLQERPRSVIMPVNHELERVLHPEDQRRKEYLKVLGEAATRDAPTSADIAQLAEFAEPYDPLLSYFLHEEAARLYDRAAAPDRHAQLLHLRHSVHYSPGEDRSVRNVVATLQLVLDEPDLIPDPQQRWDEMNALLDVLRQRSALRVQTDKTASSFELVDAEQSIKIAERAMETMDDLHAEAGVTRSEWDHRRTILERLLVRPMWTYHSRQAQRLAAIEARLQQTAEQETDEEPTTIR